MDVRPRTVSEAMTRFKQRPSDSKLDRSVRRDAARLVRRRLARPRIEDLVYVPPPAMPPRTVQRNGTDKEVSGLVDRIQHLTDRKLARSRV